MRAQEIPRDVRSQSRRQGRHGDHKYPSRNSSHGNPDDGIDERESAGSLIHLSLVLQIQCGSLSSLLGLLLRNLNRGQEGKDEPEMPRLAGLDWKIRINRPGFYCLARSIVVGWSKRSLSCFFARSFPTAGVLGTVSDFVTWSLATTSSSISSRRIRERPITSRPIAKYREPVHQWPRRLRPAPPSPVHRSSVPAFARKSCCSTLIRRPRLSLIVSLVVVENRKGAYSLGIPAENSLLSRRLFRLMMIAPLV